MSDEIVNRVAQSKLITFDLEEYYPVGKRFSLDLKNWLFEGLVLREKEFRAFVDTHDFSIYKDAYVALQCSTDAIIPGWANMLVASKLQPFAKKVVVGNLEQLETAIYQTIIEDLELTPFVNKLVIIKGCGAKPIPANAYTWLTERLQTVAKSIMYGEACSAVPIFKRK